MARGIGVFSRRQACTLACLLLVSSVIGQYVADFSSSGFNNVIVDRVDGSDDSDFHDGFEVRVEDNAALPVIPGGLPGVIFGSAAMTTQQNVILIAGPLTLSAGYGDEQNHQYYRATELWQVARQFVHWVNNVRGGLRIGDQTYYLAILLMDDQGLVETVANTTAWAMRTTRSDFALGPWGEALTRVAAMQVRLDNRVMLSAGTMASDVFESSNGSLFGLLPPYREGVEMLFHGVLEAAKEADRRDPGACGPRPCADSLVLGTLGKCHLDDRSVGERIFNSSAVWIVDVVPYLETALKNSLIWLRDNNVTVLKFCGVPLQEVHLATLLMEMLEFNPHAIIADGVDTPEFSWTKADKWWQGAHILDVAPWSQSYPVRGSWSNLTSAEFASDYVVMTGWFPSYRGAAQFAALTALSAAMEAAGSLNIEDVKHKLREMELQEFYGNISFNEFGQTKQPQLVFQSQSESDESSRYHIVFPRHVAETTMVFPKPSWPQQKCTYETKRCSGRGKCSKNGTCVCRSGWIGKACEAPFRPPQPSPPPPELNSWITVLAFLGFAAVLAMAMALVFFLIRRGQRQVRDILADLDRGIAEEDTEVERSAKRKLYALGWGQQKVADEVAGIRKRQSEQSGVSVAYLLSDEFLQLARQRSGKQDPTFYDLKHAFFLCPNPLGELKACPRDGRLGCALVDWIPRQHRKPCTHFLSWTWGYKLSVVRCALENWLEVESKDGSEVFLYMCFFVNNQHRIIVSGQQAGSQDLGRTFATNLKRIGRVIAMLDTWDEPKYLTRVWTIYEQAMCIKHEVPVTMVLPRVAAGDILREIEQGKDGIIRVKNSLTKVDSESAKADVPEDEKNVKDLINRECGGFAVVDQKIRAFMIEWVCMVMEVHMKTLVKPETNGSDTVPRLPCQPSDAWSLGVVDQPQDAGRVLLMLGVKSPAAKGDEIV